MLTAAYGSWSSPVTVEMMTSATVGLGTPTVDGSDLYWTEARADQGGRTSLFRQSPGGNTVELTPDPFYVRSRVHEYGGGEYAARSGVAVFSHFADGRVYAVRGESAPTPLTPEAAHRFADLRLHPERNLVLAVREDHTGPGEAVNTIVALALDGPNAAGGVVLCSGADFYANPELSADGRLAWTEWDHPAMPWDATRIRVGQLAGDQVGGVQEVAASSTTSLAARTAHHLRLSRSSCANRGGCSGLVSTAAAEPSPADTEAVDVPSGVSDDSSPVERVRTPTQPAPLVLQVTSSRSSSTTAYGCWPSRHIGVPNSAAAGCRGWAAPPDQA